MLAIQRARNTSGWLRHVAGKYGVPVAEVRRMLGTTRALNEEGAILLNDMARNEALALVADDGKPPVGGDLYSDLVRRYHFALFSEKKRKANEAAKRAFQAEALEESIRRGGASSQ